MNSLNQLSRNRHSRNSKNSQSRSRKTRLRFFEKLEERAMLAAFVVNSSLDVVDANDPWLTFPEAISLANNSPNVSQVDEIYFNIPESDPGFDPVTESFNIRLQTSLPPITESVLIDGFSQPGAAPNSAIVGIDSQLKIVINGNHESNPAGIVIQAPSTTIRGLVINGFAGPAINLNGADAGGSLIQGNFIGTDVTGTIAEPNNREEGPFNGTFDGAIWVNSASNNLIGGASRAAKNLISGNQRFGISYSGLGEQLGNRVEGNFIGTDRTGTQPLGNEIGIKISGISGVSIGRGNLLGPYEGNLISGNHSHGIQTSGGGNKIRGNFIGTDVSGFLALGNGGDGVNSLGGVDIIGGTVGPEYNLISANGGYGVSSNGSTMKGNVFGSDISATQTTDPNGASLSNNGLSENYDVLLRGTASLPSRFGGVEPGAGNVASGDILIAGFSIIEGNRFNYALAIGTEAVQIGGATLGAGNIVATRIDINSQGPVTIQGNTLGIDPDSSEALGQGGILVRTSGHVIGTDGDGLDDPLEGNVLNFVRLFGAGATNNRVSGNKIGTDATGTKMTANGGTVWVYEGAAGNLIGTDGDGISDDVEGNMIAGYVASSATGLFRSSVFVNGNGNVVAGNTIGTDSSGNLNFGDSEYGILVDSFQAGGPRNRIGTNGDGVSDEIEGNTIAYHSRDAIATYDGQTIRGNRIYGNDELGIDHDLDGVTLNDVDAPIPTTNRQNFPILERASAGANTQVRGTLDSAADTFFVIDFYANDVADESGHGEGRRWLGSTEVLVSDENGHLEFDVALPESANPNEWITATATRLEVLDSDQMTELALGQTSEFSLAVVAADNTPPVIEDQAFSIVENSDSNTLIGSVIATDVDLPDDALMWTVISGDTSGAFNLNPNTGELKVANSALLDFETSPVFNLTVQIADSLGETDTANVAVNLVDVAARISGTVFVDVDLDGQFDGGSESGIDQAIVELLDESGTILETDLTSMGGVFAFLVQDELATYRIRQQQPTGVDDGIAIVGDADGNGIDGEAIDGDVLSSNEMRLTLTGTDAVDYLFTEFGKSVRQRDTAEIGFWQNNRGQALIEAGGANLVNWLNGNFSNIFGDTFLDGEGGDDAAEVANFYREEFFRKKLKGTSRVDAEFMSLVFSAFFTSSNLTGSAIAIDYGFDVTETGIGTAIVNVGSSGAAFDVADGSNMTILSLLWVTNSLTGSDEDQDAEEDFSYVYDTNGDGILDMDELTLRELAMRVYRSL